MKKILYFLLVGTIFSFGSLNAQTKIELNVGDDLITVAETAAEGDTILIMQGTHKAQWATVVLDKSLVIMGEKGDDLPKLYLKQMDAPADGVTIEIMGLEISGATLDSIAGTEDLDDLACDYVVNLIAGTGELSEFGDIKIKNCIIRNINKAIVRGDRDTYTVDNFLFDNIIAYDFRGGSDYGPFRLKSKILFDSFTISNSTFYNFLNKIVDCQDMITHPAVFTIEQSTFHNMGGGKSGNYLFDIEDNEQASLTIESCILGTTNATELVLVNGFRVNEAANIEMLYTAMTPGFVISTGDYATTEWSKTEYNLESFDPVWADPDNGDFTIPEGSDLLQWNSEGKIIGDPRWHPLIDGVNKFRAENSLSIYPNPATNMINIELNHENARVEIYNSIGTIVKVVNNAHGNIQIDISDLNNGLYFIKTSNSDKAGKLLKR